MRVLLLANYLPDGQQSMQRYAEMIRQLLPPTGCDVEIIRPEPFFGRLKPSAQGLGKWLGYLDKFLVFPWILRRRLHALRGEPILVHICDHSNAIYTRWLRDVPHLVTCHDVLAIQSARGLIPGQRTGWTGRILQRWILSGLRRAAWVACVSDSTRTDLLALAPELAGRSSILENGLNYPYAPLSREEALSRLTSLNGHQPAPIIAGRFLFHIGGNHWYKNREGVIRIFAELNKLNPGNPVALIMAGEPPTVAMRALATEAGFSNRVLFLEAISNEELQALYSLAEALVFPSLREGFGWPLIEAQACGCPVITSDRPPMRDLAGPAALLANPSALADFAGRIAELLGESPEVRQRRKMEAIHHAEQYDPARFSQKIRTLYDKRLKL